MRDRSTNATSRSFPALERWTRVERSGLAPSGCSTRPLTGPQVERFGRTWGLENCSVRPSLATGAAAGTAGSKSMNDSPRAEDRGQSAAPARARRRLVVPAIAPYRRVHRLDPHATPPASPRLPACRGRSPRRPGRYLMENVKRHLRQPYRDERRLARPGRSRGRRATPYATAPITRRMGGPRRRGVLHGDRPTRRHERGDTPLQRLLKCAGRRRARFRALRHTTTILLLGADVHPKVVASLLGHSTVQITLDTYSHVTPGLARQAVEQLDRLIANSIANWSRATGDEHDR